MSVLLQSTEGTMACWIWLLCLSWLCRRILLHSERLISPSDTPNWLTLFSKWTLPKMQLLWSILPEEQIPNKAKRPVVRAAETRVKIPNSFPPFCWQSEKSFHTCNSVFSFSKEGCYHSRDVEMLTQLPSSVSKTARAFCPKQCHAFRGLTCW